MGHLFGHAATEDMASSHLDTGPLIFLRALVMFVLRLWFILTLAPNIGI